MSSNKELAIDSILDIIINGYKPGVLENKDFYKAHQTTIDEMAEKKLITIEKGGKKIIITDIGKKNYNDRLKETLDIPLSKCELLQSFYDNLFCKKILTKQIGTKKVTLCEYANIHIQTLPPKVPDGGFNRRRLANTYAKANLTLNDPLFFTQTQCPSLQTPTVPKDSVLVLAEEHVASESEALKKLMPDDWKLYVEQLQEYVSKLKASRGIPTKSTDKSFKREMGERAVVGLALGTLARGGSELGKTLAKKK